MTGPWRLSFDGLQSLFDALIHRGYRLEGPTIRHGAIVYDDVYRVADLPIGWADEQEKGRYRLIRRQDSAAFGFVVGPHSWKKVFLPPNRRLWKAEKFAGNPVYQIVQDPLPEEKLALLGVRACELAAIQVQDRVLAQGPYRDPYYVARRQNLFIVAVNCSLSAPTCFCVSMQTGPKVSSGFDLSLTEIFPSDMETHRFVVAAGSELGREMIGALPVEPATEADCQAAERAVTVAAQQQTRTLDRVGIKDRLVQAFEHPRLNEIASRCLSCANCTMVCPTCFCTHMEDTTNLTGTTAERHRHWNSCFSLDHSEMHGGAVRQSTASRYRQWLTHKLSTWIDQFGTSGCVGCGRCITWCPVGIDLTEEAAAFSR